MLIWIIFLCRTLWAVCDSVFSCYAIHFHWLCYICLAINVNLASVSHNWSWRGHGESRLTGKQTHQQIRDFNTVVFWFGCQGFLCAGVVFGLRLWFCHSIIQEVLVLWHGSVSVTVTFNKTSVIDFWRQNTFNRNKQNSVCNRLRDANALAHTHTPHYCVFFCTIRLVCLCTYYTNTNDTNHKTHFLLVWASYLWDWHNLRAPVFNCSFIYFQCYIASYIFVHNKHICLNASEKCHDFTRI